MDNLDYLDYSNQQNELLAAEGGQQRGLVALTIRGSVLLYSVTVCMPDFHSVVEFRYIYEVNLIEAKTLFYH